MSALGQIFGGVLGPVLPKGSIDDALRKTRVEDERGLRDQHRRNTGGAVVPLVHLPENTALRVRGRRDDERAAGRGQSWSECGDDSLSRLRLLFVSPRRKATSSTGN